jgi:aspartyl-tRNA(Asn)/glutamyl-tRNA(Gln) amidotransferase subunit C
MPAITIEEVRATAALARLALPPDDDDPALLRLAAELGRILDHAAQLSEVDVTDVEPTTHAVDIAAPLRPDEITGHLPSEAVLRCAPPGGRHEDYFTVPAVLDREG